MLTHRAADFPPQRKASSDYHLNKQMKRWGIIIGSSLTEQRNQVPSIASYIFFSNQRGYGQCYTIHGFQGLFPFFLLSIVIALKMVVVLQDLHKARVYTLMPRL